ncbi:DoxX family protein [soil metagenome]
MSRFKTVMRWLTGLLMVAAGANHFLNEALYVGIMPHYFPYPRELVWISGVAEMGLGAALLVPRFQVLAAWGLIALLVAVFPANINMLQHPDVLPQAPLWVLWLRLPLQGVFIGWAYWFTRLDDRGARGRGDSRYILENP